MADIGWIALADANTYFTTRLENAEWTGLTDAQKTAALTTSYNRIRYLKDYDIPSSPTDAQKAVLADAECELAYYMLIHLADEDRRKGLQAQGVVQAGVVKEAYVETNWSIIKPDSIPLPPIVKQMLTDFYKENLLYLMHSAMKNTQLFL